MIIGTVRPEEARVFDQFAGFHSFHTDTAAVGVFEEYGSFEIFWQNAQQATWSGHGEPTEELTPGWYWWSCFPGCMPDSGRNGPFASSRQALEDADEWNPEFDDESEARA